MTLKRAGIVAGLVILLSIPAVAFTARSLDRGRLSNEGNVVEVTPASLETLTALERGGFSPGMKLLAEREGVAFYIGESSTSGLPCFGIRIRNDSPMRSGTITVCRNEAAPAGGPIFPSADAPVGDLSILRGEDEGPSGEPRRVYVRRLAGFAADGVAKVGVVFTDGTAHWSSVEGNVYASQDVPLRPAKAIVGEDLNGRTVFERPLIDSP